MAIDPDDIPPAIGETVRLDEDPRFKKAQAEHTTSFGAPPLTSREDAIKWVDSFAAITSIVGKHMIIDERLGDEIQLRTEKDFIASVRNIKINIVAEDGTSKSTPVSQLWLDWLPRRTYERGIVFDPKWEFDSKTMRSGAYNKWQGFAIKPIQGPCPLALDLIKRIICNNDEKHCHYTTGWTSQIFQEPWNKLGTALVLRGLKGIGKSFFAKIISWLMDGKPGQERRQKLFLTVDNRNSIFGNHNDHLENILGLCWEEAMWAGDRAHESSFKNIISGQTLFVNPKNLPGRTVVNYIRSIILSNSDWVVPATHDERRFFVLNVNSEQKDDRTYFDALEDELLNKGGLEALMYYFMNYRYDDINLRTALVTEAQIEQKTSNMSGVERWWFDILCSGKLPFVKCDENGYWVIKEQLLINYNITQQRHKLNEREFGIQFKELMPLVVNGRIEYATNGRPKNIVGTEKYSSSGGERLNVHVIPKLETCRQLMNMRIKTEYDYGNGSQEWEIPTFNEKDVMRSYSQW